MLGYIVFHARYKIKKYLNKLRVHALDRALMVPKMTYREYRLFTSLLEANRTALYLESGSGGSTVIADTMGLNYHSYETSAGYATYMNALLKGKNVNHIPVGDVVKYGRPVHVNAAITQKISTVFDTHLSTKKNAKSIVFLDGRCRVLTALHIHSLLNKEDIVMMHDFHRQKYQDVLHAYDVMQQVDTLVCLKKKKVSEKMMDKLCQDYAVDTE